ncbi:MAG: PEGA domain-containing protein [Treponema sp.]|jgi:hypothetical protein|nr:PEGA domain-containing protein [Treponema sp.]
MEMTVVVKDENGVLIENADVYLNNKPIGKTPFVKKKVSHAVWKSYQIMVKKEGYLDTEITSKRGVHIVHLIIGFIGIIGVIITMGVGLFLGLLLLFWLWAYGTSKVQTITLKTDPKNRIRKCPSCGETIQPMQTRCEACGALVG